MSVTTPTWPDARRFVEVIAGRADPTMTFQVFDDKGEREGIAGWRSGKLSDESVRKWLFQKSTIGCGIFVTINETDGKGRHRKNILTGRAIFADFDSVPLPEEFAVPPDLIDESSPGKFHVYWLIEPTDDLQAWSDCQARIAAYYGADPKVFDPPRVLRLPGFDHQKGKPFRVRMLKCPDPECVELDGISRRTLSEVAAAHPCEYKSPRVREEFDRKSEPIGGWDNETDVEDARVYLTDIDPPAEGNRNNDGYRVAAYLNDIGISPELSFELMSEIWNPRLDAPLEDHELQHVINSAGRYKADPPGKASEATKGIEAQEEFEEAPPVEFTDAPQEEEEAPANWDDLAPIKPKSNRQHAGGVTYRRADTIAPEKLKWLWPERFPLGKLSILAGFPDQGKSQITLNMAAVITTGGEWGDHAGSTDPGGVLILSSEDDAADTLIPRLKAAGANLSRVIIVESMVRVIEQGRKRRRVLNIEDDLRNLTMIMEAEAKRGNIIRAMFLDPINAYLGGARKGDSHKNSDMRALLTPIAEWAARYKLSVIAISHFNKGGNAHTLYRVTDSGAITAAARAVWFAVRDTTNKDDPKFMLLSGKHNLSKETKGLFYAIEERDIGHDIKAPYVVWKGECGMSADQVLAPSLKGNPMLQSAEDFLQDALGDGAKPMKELVANAKGNGISESTLRRAKLVMGVKAEVRGGKLGKGGAWWWELPTIWDGEDEPADEFIGDGDLNTDDPEWLR